MKLNEGFALQRIRVLNFGDIKQNGMANDFDAINYFLSCRNGSDVNRFT